MQSRRQKAKKQAKEGVTDNADGETKMEVSEDPK